MKEDYINEIYLANDETHKKIIKDTMKNLEEIKLDINEIRNEIKNEKQPNISHLLILSSLI